ncbi:esterase [Neobacillus sp. SM06]|uniref:esterase n=1 Tax=Neobacillus sp. SM06 TaxID=3422492 RepID=UPI003D26B939
MIIIEKERIEGIPLLHVAEHDARWQKLPLIIFIHGFTSVKERNLHYAYLLADAGFRVVLPEALYHGERTKGLKPEDFYQRFWEIVLATIEEIKSVKEHYDQKELIMDGEVGVAGTSMGGIAALGALTQYPWIKAAVSLMGMPAYEKFSYWQLEQLKKQGIHLPFTDEEIKEQIAAIRQYDLSLQPQKLANRPLLFWHGKKDPMVPYELTRGFFESIRKMYSGNEEKLAFISDEHAGHNVSIAGVEAAVDWFKQYLNNRSPQKTRETNRVGVNIYE